MTLHNHYCCPTHIPLTSELNTYVTKKNSPPKKNHNHITFVSLLSPLLGAHGAGLQLTATAEYNNYVHTYINSSNGNYTVLDKPMFPVMINSSQIQIGANWTIMCPLQEGHDYHVYCYGAWVNTSSAAKTDYDIYVYNPQGTLESSHTAAAGFPEHLGTTTDDSLFTPQQTGNYSFVIINDPRESQGAQQLTFMVLEALTCNEWHTAHIDGTDGNNKPDFDTCWAYEFVTNASQIDIYINVPDTLDMYEARLYPMSDSSSLSINDYPLPWEPGLYGNISATTKVGGYNFENNGYRGVATLAASIWGNRCF